MSFQNSRSNIILNQFSNDFAAKNNKLSRHEKLHNIRCEAS